MCMFAMWRIEQWHRIESGTIVEQRTGLGYVVDGSENTLAASTQ